MGQRKKFSNADNSFLLEIDHHGKIRESFGLPSGVDFNQWEISSISPETKRIEEVRQNSVIELSDKVKAVLEGWKWVKIKVFSSVGSDVMLLCERADDFTKPQELKRRAELAEEINEILKKEIQEHKKTQGKLQEAEEFAKNVINSTQTFFISFNKDLKINGLNNAAENQFGILKRGLGKVSLSDLLQDELDISGLINEVNEDKTQEVTFRCKGKNDKPFWVTSSFSVLRNERGEIKGYLWSSRDISETIESRQRARNVAAKLEAIFESGNILFWTVNRNTALTSFNAAYSKAIEDLYGEKPEINKDLSEPKRKFASDDYHDFWSRKYEEVFNSGQSINFQTQTFDKQGNVYYRDIFLNPIRYADDEVIHEVAGMALDITDKKLAQRKMQEQSGKINAIFNATNHMIWSVDTGFNLTYFNEIYRKRLKERHGVDVYLGMNSLLLLKMMGKDLPTKWEKHYRKVLEGEKLLIESSVIDQNQKEHIEEISLSPIFDEDGNVVEIAALAQTVTFKKTAEKKLKDQAAKIHAIFDSTAMLIWSVDKDYHIVSYNKVFADQHFKLLGKEVSIGSNFLKLIREHVDSESYDDLEYYFKGAFRGEKQQFEGIVTGRDGNRRWMETFFSPIYSDKNEIKEISCLSYEVTDKKIIEEQMRESIHEKEVLLQEVHHRVKNNLQVISSILNLQSSYVKDENSLSILRESQNRIKSMSFIHESLYQTKDFSRIEFSDYILSLTNNLIHSYSYELGSVKLRTDFEKTFLSLDQAIPCGLIANELVSNALKYAFPGGQPGEIFISVKERDKKIRMIIADNGIGLPQGFDHTNSDSLGLQLVHTLVEQLDASIEHSREKGTEYLITFDKQ